jgi:hypothetical protein
VPDAAVSGLRRRSEWVLLFALVQTHDAAGNLAHQVAAEVRRLQVQFQDDLAQQVQRRARREVHVEESAVSEPWFWIGFREEKDSFQKCLGPLQSSVEPLWRVLVEGERLIPVVAVMGSWLTRSSR